MPFPTYYSRPSRMDRSQFENNRFNKFTAGCDGVDRHVKGDGGVDVKAPFSNRLRGVTAR
jgi:hypothetical protein